MHVKTHFNSNGVNRHTYSCPLLIDSSKTHFNARCKQAIRQIQTVLPKIYRKWWAKLWMCLSACVHVCVCVRGTFCQRNSWKGACEESFEELATKKKILKEKEKDGSVATVLPWPGYSQPRGKSSRWIEQLDWAREKKATHEVSLKVVNITLKMVNRKKESGLICGPGSIYLMSLSSPSTLLKTSCCLLQHIQLPTNIRNTL